MLENHYKQPPNLCCKGEGSGEGGKERRAFAARATERTQVASFGATEDDGERANCSRRRGSRRAIRGSGLSGPAMTRRMR